MYLLLAAREWPDEIDTAITALYIGMMLALPVLGYLCMVLDIRAYLRSLRRALVRAHDYLTDIPAWARKDTPRCLLALGLTLPCGAQEVLIAYREKVKRLHPDRGGDRQAFLRLQRHFEDSLRFVESYE